MSSPLTASVSRAMDPSPEPAAPPTRSRRALVLGLLALVFVIAALVYGHYWYRVARFRVETADAYVQGNLIQVMPQVSGFVAAVHADDTQLVHEGDTLVELDTTDARLALDRAELNLAETVREVRQLYRQEQEQEAAVRSQQATLEQAERDFRRAAGLYATHNVSDQQYQTAETARTTAQAALAQAQEQLRALQAITAGTTADAHPRVKLAIAGLREAYLALARTRILAPVTGYVAQRGVQVGQQVAPGKPLLAVVPLDQVWVAANFKETELARMRIGQPARVQSDFYGSDVVYGGKVAGLSPGTGSAFELLPPQNATGNWIKVVQRLPVRILIPSRELERHPLRLGLSMQVEVDLRDTGGPALGAAPAAQGRYRTDIYAHAEQGLDALVARILSENTSDPKTGAGRDGGG